MDYARIEQISAMVKEKNPALAAVRQEISRVIVGQEGLVERILIAMLCEGHILLEGLPGLAKTLTVRSFARTLDAVFQRIQFTPDLLPADLTGTRVYNPRDLDFFTRKGPVFCNILLADEINRAPAKVQSALLQAMEERTVTIGDETFALPRPFMVLATENPIEQVGTYPLPEAQLDRFFLKCLVEYPTAAEEQQILERIDNLDPVSVQRVLTPAAVLELQDTVRQVYVDEKLKEYIVNIVAVTRKAVRPELARLIDFGASPRASIALLKAARCVAFLRGRGFVVPDDIKKSRDVLRTGLFFVRGEGIMLRG